MADNNKPSTSKALKNDDDNEYDPTVDFFSPKFDPLKALYTPNLKVPFPSAKVHDNLSKYYTYHTMEDINTEKKKPGQEPELFQRRFLPHQLPVPVKRKPVKNILTRMETARGPLECLKRWVDERARVKVWTRHSHGIRGYCEAFVAAFDKHWNLALTDVNEFWTRPRRRKTPAGLSISQNPDGQTKEKKIEPPKIFVTKVKGKVEYCERHVPQLLIRGEQIVYISINE